MQELGGPPALRAATGRGQAVQGYASLPCCAPLPLVVPFPSFPHSPDAAAAERDDRSTLRPTSFRSLRQRCAPFIAPDVPLHSACYGSGRCIRPASATAKPPHGPLPAGQPAAHRQPTAPLPCRARPPKGPHAARQHPGCGRRSPAGKRRPPAPKVCVQATQAKVLGPLRGGFHWGGPQTPAIMPRLTPGHLPRVPPPPVGWPLHPQAAGSAEYSLGPAPNPLKKAFSGCSAACPGPLPVG